MTIDYGIGYRLLLLISFSFELKQLITVELKTNYTKVINKRISRTQVNYACAVHMLIHFSMYFGSK